MSKNTNSVTSPARDAGQYVVETVFAGNEENPFENRCDTLEEAQVLFRSLIIGENGLLIVRLVRLQGDDLTVITEKNKEARYLAPAKPTPGAAAPDLLAALRRAESALRNISDNRRAIEARGLSVTQQEAR